MSSLPEPQPEPIAEPSVEVQAVDTTPVLQVEVGGAGPLPPEISEEELAAALLNPVDLEEQEPVEADELELSEEEVAQLTAELHQRYPHIQEQIDAYNATAGAYIDLNQLESQASTVVDQTVNPGEPSSTAEIDDLVSQVREVDEPGPTAVEIPDDGAMSDADIAALFDKVQASDPVTPEPGEGVGIEAPQPATETPAAEDDPDAPMSLEEIQRLVLQSESLGAPSQPEAPSPTDQGDLKILGVDALQQMLENDARLSAPSGAFEEPKVEPEPISGIPMVDEDAHFEPPAEPVTLVDEQEMEPVPESAEWDPEVIARVPMALAVAALALPLRFEDEKLVCLVADPIDHGAVGQISQALHCMVETRPAPIGDVVRSLRAAYTHADASSARLAMDAAARSGPGLVGMVTKLWKKVS